MVGWWYLLKLLKQPGAPMGRRQADDLVFYATLGIILGGRIGYVLFYGEDMFRGKDAWHAFLEIFRLWAGGMSLHGGVIGTCLALLLFARAHKLSWLRVQDYVACCAPFGLLFVRIANFINGELWGRPSDLPWAIRFTERAADGTYFVGPARHPSQLYEALLEGPLLFAVLWWAFWRTPARYEPGKLLGLGLLVYGLIRFNLEFVREPDAQLAAFTAATHLHMGQWLCVPMILGGGYLVATAKGRRQRVVPIAGTESVA